jgi:hypothetical protein
MCTSLLGSTAMQPNVGSTNFRRFFNSQTGAYAYSAANADVQFFTSRGHTFDGYAWSVSWPISIRGDWLVYHLYAT